MIHQHPIFRCGVRMLAGSALFAPGLFHPAASQITIDPTTAATDAVYIAGHARPGHTTNPVKNADGVISYFYTNSWIEVPFTVETAGVYELSIPFASTVTDLKAQVHIRAAGSNIFWASDALAVPTSGDWGTFVAVNVPNIPILEPGAHLLRVANTKLQHHSAADRDPAYENDPGTEGPSTGPARGTGFNFGIMTLTRAGDLPPTGTLAGTVTSSDLGGIPVAGAAVMAYTGADVLEPGPLWQKGFWTTTGSSGAFSLTVPAATYTVQTGQPSMYQYAGTGVGNAAVVAGQTRTVSMDLPSRWTKTEDNRNTVQVEVEYFTAKNPDVFDAAVDEYNASPVVVQGRPISSNGMNAGYLDIGNFIDIPVDVPAGQGGEYTVTDLYFNGYWNGVDYFDAITQVIANPGTAEANTVQAVEPNTTPKDEFDTYVGRPDTGYSVRGSVTYESAIVLKEGHNIIRMQAAGTGGQNAASAWDALVLTQVNIPVPTGSAAKALKVAAGLEAVAAGDLAALNVVTTGESSDRIDILDAIALARDGKL